MQRWRSVGEIMAPTFHVKARFLLATALCLCGSASGEDTPDAREILKAVRSAQTAQQQSLHGQLRTGPKTIPFQLTMSGNTVRWDFTDPPQALQLRLGE